MKFAWRKGLGKGLCRDLEIGFGSDLRACNGGLLDAPIEWYYQLLGMVSEQRTYWFSISENGGYNKYNAPFGATRRPILH